MRWRQEMIRTALSCYVLREGADGVSLHTGHDRLEWYNSPHEPLTTSEAGAGQAQQGHCTPGIGYDCSTRRNNRGGQAGQEEEQRAPVDRGRAQGNERETKSCVGCKEEV